MEKILPGKYVEISYDLFEVAPDGTENLVHSVTEDEPERFIFGVTKGMILPLERALDGLEQGRVFDVPVNAGEGSPITPTTWPSSARASSWSTESLTPKPSARAHTSP